MHHTRHAATVGEHGSVLLAERTEPVRQAGRSSRASHARHASPATHRRAASAHDPRTQSRPVRLRRFAPAIAALLLLGAVTVLLNEVRVGRLSGPDLAAAAVAIAATVLAAVAVAPRHTRSGVLGPLADRASGPIFVVRPDLTVVAQTSSVTAVLGYPPADLVGRRLVDLIHPDDADAFAAAHAARLDDHEPTLSIARFRTVDGEWRRLEISHTDLRDDPRVAGVVLVARDITGRSAIEDQLRHLASHDPVTGLGNRDHFLDQAEGALGDPQLCAVVALIGLDDLPTVLDTYGHPAGDSVLATLGARLRDDVPHGSALARVDGDQFAVLLRGTDEHACVRLVRRLHDRLSRPVELDGEPVACHLSIGIATEADGVTAQELLDNAEVARRAARCDPAADIRIFTCELADRALRRRQFRADLREALERGELATYFQPTVDLDTHEVVGVEALARWLHPDGQVVPPQEFIALAEQTGQIVAVGRYVLERACRAAVRWHRDHPAHAGLSVAVNVSARELEEPDLADCVARVLDETGLQPQLLTLEVTESLVVDDAGSARRQLETLRRLGVRIALDDFGTGFSSLSYLENLPVDVIKIDRSFVRRLVAGRDNPVVAAIMTLARSLGLGVVAEGVETDDQAQALRELGATTAQGFLFHQPLTRFELDALLRRAAHGPVPAVPA